MNLPDNASGDSTEQNKPLRLQTALAHAGVASRRSAETIILDGRVTVNGQLVTVLGTKVLPTDIICVDGVQIHKENVKHYILLNKPAGYVCSLSDEKNRPVAADILKPHFAERLYNVGRLDMFSSGLIIFTNDGDFAATVSHPSAELEKEYMVETSLPFPPDLPEKFMKGVRVDGVFYKCLKAERLNSRRLKIVLIEGKNREIRRVLEHFDVRVKSLVRTRIGTLVLDNQPGEFKVLSAEQVYTLLSVCKNHIERGE